MQPECLFIIEPATFCIHTAWVDLSHLRKSRAATSRRRTGKSRKAVVRQSSRRIPSTPHWQQRESEPDNDGDGLGFLHVAWTTRNPCARWRAVSG